MEEPVSWRTELVIIITTIIIMMQQSSWSEDRGTKQASECVGTHTQQQEERGREKGKVKQASSRRARVQLVQQQQLDSRAKGRKPGGEREVRQTARKRREKEIRRMQETNKQTDRKESSEQQQLSQSDK